MDKTQGYNSYGIWQGGLSPLVSTTDALSSSIPNLVSDSTAPESLSDGQLINTLNQAAGTVFAGKKNFTTTNNTAGYRLGFDSDNICKFLIGNATNYLFWNGTSLTVHGVFNIGGTVITIDNTQDIQTYLNTINTAGGGTLYLTSGTYTLTSAGLTMYSSVALIGSSPTGTIINMNSTGGEIDIAGTFRYNTGTITSITSGVNVTGSGTLWLANVVAGRDHFFINGQWCIIAAVLTNTTLTLAEGYDGSTIGAGTAYRISTPIQNVMLGGFTVKNSTGSAIDIDDARFITITNVVSQSNNIGAEANYVTEWQNNEFNPILSTSHGISATNGGRYSWTSVNAASNGGSGVVLNSIRSMLFIAGVSDSNTADGVNLTSCNDCTFTTFSANANGSQGVEAVSGNNNLCFIDSGIAGNISDGIKFTATTDNSQIIGGNIEGNGGWGINIAASTCDNNVVAHPSYGAGNTSGNLTDSGTNTTIVGNVAYKNSTTTKNIADANATQTIAHGLSQIPKKVRITSALLTSTTLPPSMSYFSYNGTTGAEVHVAINNATAQIDVGTTIVIWSQAVAAAFNTGTVTVDATNINIAWVKTSSPTGIANIMWEAEA